MRSTSFNGVFRLAIDANGFEYEEWRAEADFPVETCVCNLSYFFNGAFDLHWHKGLEFTVVLQGQMEYQVNDKHYRMEKGDCVFVNSGAMHSGRYVDDGGCRYLVISFLTSAIDGDPDGAFAKKFFEGVMDAKSLPSMLFENGSNDMSSLCISIHEIMKKKEDGWEIEVKGILCQLWHLFYKEAKRLSGLSVEKPLSVSPIKKAIRYMNDNYASKLNLEEIASMCNLSKSEFCRCFKRITRQTAFEYLMGLRIKKSIQLLEEEGLSVTEAAQNTGFSNSSYYTKIFRRYMGGTPREYLRRRKG